MMPEVPMPELACSRCGRVTVELDPLGECAACERADRMRRADVTPLEYEHLVHSELYTLAHQLLGEDHPTTALLGRRLISVATLAELDRLAGG